MLVGRRYRLELTPAQAEFAETIGGICRSVWNTALEQRRTYRQRGGWISYPEQARQLAEAKTEYPWLAQAPSHTLQQTLRDLDKACRTHGTGKVRWRSQRRWAPSFRFPDGPGITVERLNRRWARVKLPKVGWVRLRWSRPLGGAIRSATVRREGRHWYISILVEDGTITPERHAHPASQVGIDRGVKALAVTSDGAFYDKTYANPREIERVHESQRRVARTQKTSHRRTAARAKLTTALGKIRRRREDFTTKLGAHLARAHGLVVFEALNTKGMTASAAGTVEEPGRNVRAKAGLNRAILDKGWYRLERAVRNTARFTGTLVLTINPAYTSQTCSVPSCRRVDRKSRESQAVFRCTTCGHTEHADVNAAKSILTAGRAEGTTPTNNSAGCFTAACAGWNPPAVAVGRTSIPARPRPGHEQPPATWREA